MFGVDLQNYVAYIKTLYCKARGVFKNLSNIFDGLNN